MTQKTPITLISGFLGAGKTTLINNILRGESNHRLAVIVNDMAAVNIDGHEISAALGQGALIELENGCICCSLREDLIHQLLELTRHQRFDRIIIEATGISEPRHVAAGFLSEDTKAVELRCHASLEQFVTVVDSINFNRLLFLAEDVDKDLFGVPRTVADILAEQVEFANLIILNKATEKESGLIIETEALVKSLNPNATILKTEFAKIRADQIFELGLTQDKLS